MTDGSTAWFRDRIRRTFLDGTKLDEIRSLAAGLEKTAPAMTTGMTLFEGKPRAERYQQRRYRSLPSRSLPDGIAAVRMVQPAADGEWKVEGSSTFSGNQPQ